MYYYGYDLHEISQLFSELFNPSNELDIMKKAESSAKLFRVDDLFQVSTGIMDVKDIQYMQKEKPKESKQSTTGNISEKQRVKDELAAAMDNQVLILRMSSFDPMSGGLKEWDKLWENQLSLYHHRRNDLVIQEKVLSPDKFLTDEDYIINTTYSRDIQSNGYSMWKILGEDYKMKKVALAASHHFIILRPRQSFAYMDIFFLHLVLDFLVKYELPKILSSMEKPVLRSKDIKALNVRIPTDPEDQQFIGEQLKLARIYLDYLKARVDSVHQGLASMVWDNNVNG